MSSAEFCTYDSVEPGIGAYFGWPCVSSSSVGVVLTYTVGASPSASAALSDFVASPTIWLRSVWTAAALIASSVAVGASAAGAQGPLSDADVTQPSISAR